MADVKLVLLADVWGRQEKNEDGDLVNRTVHKGEEVTVRSAVAERLLDLESGGRPLFKRVNDDDPEDKDVVSEEAARIEKSDEAPRVPADPSSNDKVTPDQTPRVKTETKSSDNK